MQQIIFVTMEIDKPHYINTIYYKIEQTAKYCRNLGAQIFRKLGMPMSPDEFTTLDTISIYGEICQRDLAKLILKDRPSTGRLLNSLEEQGYIKRFVDVKNNRLVRKMSLTDKGTKILKEATNVIKEYFEKLPRVLSKEDKDSLENYIQKLRQGLEQEVEMKI